MKAKIRLSILDQSLLTSGHSGSEAIHDTINLVKVADELGYTRYWVAEHHNVHAVAGSAPEVFIAHLAGITKRIRIGSGGVMLTNHSPLKVAENFRTLEVLFPGRIDLGLGRASGTNPKTEQRILTKDRSTESYSLQVKELLHYLDDLTDEIPDPERIYAIPRVDSSPQVWLLSSGPTSSAEAAALGTGLAYASFIRPAGGQELVENYRKNFQPSFNLQTPEVIVGTSVFCSEDPAEVARQQAVIDHRFLQIATTGDLPIISYEEIKDITYTDEQQQKVLLNRSRFITGTPDIVKQKLDELIASYQASELIISNLSESAEGRLTSYTLLAAMYLND